MSEKINLKGRRFGRLVVLEEGDKTKEGLIRWHCLCDCGREKIVSGKDLRKNRTKSCGCFQKDVLSKLKSTHNQTDSPTYKSWKGMHRRCYNSNYKRYPDYGGRGIGVCERWHSFENFLEDMGERPKGKTIDRIDPDGNYEPSNCRWATPEEQSRNIRGKGYYWRPDTQKWGAQISLNGSHIHLGYFNREEDARQAYIKGKKKYHGISLEE